METEPKPIISNPFDWIFEPKKGAKTNGLALGNMLFAQSEERMK